MEQQFEKDLNTSINNNINKGLIINEQTIEIKDRNTESSINYQTQAGSKKNSLQSQHIQSSKDPNSRKQSVLQELKTKQQDSKDYDYFNPIILARIINIKGVKSQSIQDWINSSEIQFDEKLLNKYKKELSLHVHFFQITIKDHTWEIRKRYIDFVNFDIQLKKEMREDKTMLPVLKHKTELQMLQEYNPEVYLKQLENYLIQITKFVRVCETNQFKNFFEISDFRHEGIHKVKETWLKKRAGGRYHYNSCLQRFCSGLKNWNNRYILITNEGIMYSISNKKPNNKIREVLLFDHNFRLDFGKKSTDRELGIKVKTTSRTIYFEANDIFQYFDSVIAFNTANNLSEYNKQHSYSSFAPIRTNQYCKWYIDAETYYQDLHDVLKEAQKDIFITGWWISPQLYLIRPVAPYQKNNPLNQTRLDNLLISLAKKGIKIYIIVYREPTIALTIDSLYTKEYLMSQSENIIILRHPKTTLPFLWSHHEKIVVVDQKIAFIGGLDLCYGRMDNKNHCLVDEGEEEYFPGIDYSNARQADYTNVQDYNTCSIDKKNTQRMPWHDIHMMIAGSAVNDVSRHFMQYWNFAKVNIYDKEHDTLQLVPTTQKPQGFRSRIKDLYKKVKLKVKSKFRGGESQNQSPNSSITTNNNTQPNGVNINEKEYEQSDTESQVSKIKTNKKTTITTIEANQNKSRFKSYLNHLKDYKTQKQNSQQQHSQSLIHQNEQQQFSHDKTNESIIESFNNSNNNNNKNNSNNSNNSNNNNTNNKSHAFFMNKNVSSFLSILQQGSNLNDNNLQRQEEEEEEVLEEEKKSQIVEEEQKGQEEKQKEQNIKLNNQPNKFLDLNLDTPKKIKKHDQLQKSNSLISQNVSQLRQSYQKSQKNSIKDEESSEDYQPQLRSSTYSYQTANKLAVRFEEGRARKLSLELNKEINVIDLLEQLQRTEQNQENINYYLVSKTKNSIESAYKNNMKSSMHINLAKSKYRKSPSINKNKPKSKLNFFSKATKEEKHQKYLSDLTEQLVNNKNNQITVDISNKAISNGTCSCQLLRSASDWSLGLQPGQQELSIQIAYLTLISSAKNYIYIENQFFISQTVSSSQAGIVKNLIANALIERIKRAAQNKEMFKVVVVMPLLPGFAGEINDNNSAIMKIQLYWEYNTISRGGNSIFEILSADPNIQDPSDYIEFYGLRQHGVLNKQPVTEIIYVHSKMMIVDDNFAIIGSANINDRSMIGVRDSEIAILTEDSVKIQSFMAQEKILVSQFSATLRRGLYQEHFGIDEATAMDPLNPETLIKIKQIVKTNTENYRHIFKCYPDDTVYTLNELEQFQKNKNLNDYEILKDSFVGHAVYLPLDFLKNENLSFSISQKEYFVPTENFT